MGKSKKENERMKEKKDGKHEIWESSGRKEVFLLLIHKYSAEQGKKVSTEIWEYFTYQFTSADKTALHTSFAHWWGKSENNKSAAKIKLFKVLILKKKRINEVMEYRCTGRKITVWGFLFTRNDMNRKPVNYQFADFCLVFAPFIFLLATAAPREGKFHAKWLTDKKGFFFHLSSPPLSQRLDNLSIKTAWL